MNRVVITLSVCLLSLCSFGCGGSSAGRVDVYPVTGTVKFNGAPVIGAFVSFTPQEGQPAATGRTDDSGKYSLTTYEGSDGAAAGNYAVIVMKFNSGSAEAGDTEAGHITDANAQAQASHSAKDAAGGDDDLLPPSYADKATTPLKAAVKSSGENVFDFELK